MRTLFSLLLLPLMFSTLSAQSSSSPLTVGPMQVNWEYEGGDIVFTVFSPGAGWVALGTNDEDGIVGASLYMGGVEEKTGKSYFSERRTIGFGRHEAKTDLEQPERAHDAVGKTSGEGTTLSFRVRSVPITDGELDLRPGQTIWLILAYSVSDDLGHHSRFRRHVQVKL